MTKKIFKFFIISLLSLCARGVLRRYKPRVVMVSGSVGKTSTKDAVATVLSTRFYVRKSEKSFNSEFGVPFTIFGVGESPWNNPIAWIRVFKSALALLLLPNHYPALLVLEVGADHPGDLARILRYVTPDAVVITRLPDVPVHVEAYASPEQLREEEFSPAYALPLNAPLIVPSDDAWSLASAKRIPANRFSYGVSDTGTVRMSNVMFYEEGGRVRGMQGTFTIKDEHITCTVNGSVGTTQLLPIAAALATAHAFGLSLPEACAAFDGYEAPPGRGRLFAGIHGSMIVDDSYNASPAAVEEALMTLKVFPHARRRIAVLGDMLELGRFSVTEHERIGALAGECAESIVTVGIRARALGAASKNVEVLHYDNAQDAARALPEYIREGDVILIKGSQSLRMERVVEALLADPLDRINLVRQEEKWKQKD